jgi:hypothetical protein
VEFLLTSLQKELQYASVFSTSSHLLLEQKQKHENMYEQLKHMIKYKHKNYAKRCKNYADNFAKSWQCRATFDPLARPSSEALSGHPVGKAKIGQSTSRNKTIKKIRFWMVLDLLVFAIYITLIVSSQIQR